MICNTKAEALKRIVQLTKLAQTSTDVMREIIKLEMKDHIREFGITRADAQAEWNKAEVVA